MLFDVQNFSIRQNNFPKTNKGAFQRRRHENNDDDNNDDDDDSVSRSSSLFSASRPKQVRFYHPSALPSIDHVIPSRDNVMPGQLGSAWGGQPVGGQPRRGL